MFKKLPEYENVYESKKTFGKDTYYLYVTIDDDRGWVALSSGKKRNHKLIFEEKDYKSSGGIQALIWARDEMLTFKLDTRTLKALCIGWADSRRRRIYNWGLKSHGFREERYRGDMILTRKY